jgi:hypothetical protein
VSMSLVPAAPMLPTEDLFVYVYVLIHDLILAGSIVIPERPGPAPACTDAELLAIAEVRHLLGRRSESAFLAEVSRDRGHLFPQLPHQSEANRRIRWLWGAFAQLRVVLAGRLPVGDCQHRSIRPRCRSSTRPGSAVRTSGRVRATTWPAGSAATPRRPSGSTGFRLAIKTGLGSRTVRPGPSCPPVPIACG